VLLLDQFPRNVFRDSPRAFAADSRALAFAKCAVANGFDLQFFYENGTRMIWFQSSWHRLL
jgi:uncharacterized protein (DUF924 family)